MAGTPRSLFPYPGSKWRLMQYIITLLPPHEHFVSAFGGSGADILMKPRSRLESFNDRDGLIHNLFSVILNGQVEQLKQRVSATPNRSQTFFDEARHILAQPITDPVKSAWAFLVAAHNGFCRAHPGLLGRGDWGYYRNARRYFSRWPAVPGAIDFVRRRFHRVQLSSWDWSEVVERLDTPQTLFFLDPPYYPDTINPSSQFYPHDMTAEQHEAMLEILRKVEGHVVLCGYGNKLYDRVLADWRRVDIPTKTNMCLRGQAESRTESLWMNYGLNGQRLAHISR